MNLSRHLITIYRFRYSLLLYRHILVSTKNVLRFDINYICYIIELLAC